VLHQVSDHGESDNVAYGADGAFITPSMNRLTHTRVDMTAATEDAPHIFEITLGIRSIVLGG
jgi:hypothetical protein